MWREAQPSLHIRRMRLNGAWAARVRDSRSVAYAVPRGPIQYCLPRSSARIIGCMLCGRREELDDVGERLLHPAEAVGGVGEHGEGHSGRNCKSGPVWRATEE